MTGQGGKQERTGVRQKQNPVQGLSMDALVGGGSDGQQGHPARHVTRGENINSEAKRERHKGAKLIVPCGLDRGAKKEKKRCVAEHERGGGENSLLNEVERKVRRTCRHRSKQQGETLQKVGRSWKRPGKGRVPNCSKREIWSDWGKDRGRRKERRELGGRPHPRPMKKSILAQLGSKGERRTGGRSLLDRFEKSRRSDEIKGKGGRLLFSDLLTSQTHYKGDCGWKEGPARKDNEMGLGQCSRVQAKGRGKKADVKHSEAKLAWAHPTDNFR